ncbi:MAG: hypothetical protein ACRDYU_09020 [Actinomycetes bacterium]
MRGDRVEIVIDAGGETRTYEITATRNGRRVEISTARGIVEVTEVTRSGTPMRTARFMANRVLALVEHPAVQHGVAEEPVPASPTPQPGAAPRSGPPLPRPA